MAACAEELYSKNVHLVGVNHRTLAVAERELLACHGQDRPALLKSLMSSCSLEEAALLSTCNRFEVVAVGKEETDGIVSFLQERLPNTLRAEAIYRYSNGAAVKHFFRVASSLDSMVVGEAQILGQVKDAYRQAIECGCVGRYLHQLFQFAFGLAKKVKANTAIAEKGVSLSYIAVQLARQIFGDLDGRSVLIIGSGRMAELAALHLKSYGCSRITVANRTLSRALELANHIGGGAIPLEEIGSYLKEVDVVIGSIQIDRPVIEVGLLKDQRRTRPLFLIDLGVPRNFSSALSELEGVYLYNVDDLSTIADENRSLREQAAKDAEVIIEYGLFQFERWLLKLSAEPAVIGFRDKVRAICEAELARTVQPQLESGRAHELVPDLAYRISQKIAHDFTSMIAARFQGELDPASLFPLFVDELLKIS